MTKTFIASIIILNSLVSICQTNFSEIDSVSLAAKESEKGTIVTETFASTRVLNNHSIEMLPKQNLEFIVAHKFGDLAGSGGGYQNWFGLDNLADVRIAFEYGITNFLNVGIGRSKGTGLITQVADGYIKYTPLKQLTQGMPISLTLVGALNIPYAPKTNDTTSITSYPTFAHRFIYTTQVIVARRFNDRFSAQINFGYNHRNYVHYTDVNGLFFGGFSARLRFTKTLGILVEYNGIISDRPNVDYTNHLAFGFEILTGGHAFCLTFANSRAITEGLFVPATVENWGQGQFRFGFSINRRFKL